MNIYSKNGYIALGLFDAKLNGCDESYSDFTGWDFEDKTMGSWTIASDTPDYKWDIIMAIMSSYHKSISHDHTTMTQFGWLAEAIDSKSKAQVNSRTVFRSPRIQQSKVKSDYYCLSFWFWKRIGNDSLKIVQEVNENLNVNKRLYYIIILLIIKTSIQFKIHYRLICGHQISIIIHQQNGNTLE